MPDGWNTTADAVAAVRRVEAQHPDWSAVQVVTSIRKLVYHGQFWDYILPDAAAGPALRNGTHVTAADVARLSRGNNLLHSPRGPGEQIDLNHVWVGMDVLAHPRMSPLVSAGLGLADGLGMATWSGDLASAVSARHAPPRLDRMRSTQNGRRDSGADATRQGAGG